MDKLIKKQFKMTIEFLQKAEKGLIEIEKIRKVEQLPIAEFLGTFNECFNNASVLYYSVELMRKLGEHVEKTEEVEKKEAMVPYV